MCIKKSFNFAVFISICRMNCYVICLLNILVILFGRKLILVILLNFLPFQYSCLQIYEYYYCLFEC